jgi:UDP-N-acetylmuramoylalanine--D-glutamate ligase
MSSLFLLYGTWKVGNSLARFCTSIGQDFVLCDDTDSPDDFSDYAAIIPSPWVPSTHRVYQSGKVISELDFLARYVPKWFQIHAVTGTDGKSTTSWILYHFLSQGFSEKPVYIGGNFGTPFADILLEIQKKGEKEGHIVLEVSSFMAYSLQTLYVTNTILTNLHPDHLDWHRDLSEYYHAKINLLAHTRDAIIYPMRLLELYPEIKDFPIEQIVIPFDFHVEHGLLQLSEHIWIDIADTRLVWHHNMCNIYAAAQLALRLWLTAKMLSTILSTIPTLPHRIQLVSEKNNKQWIDDSKSTTAQSLYAALSSFSDKKVYLIAGGKDKGDNFEELSRYLAQYCAQCAIIGETRPRFLQACHEAFVPATSFATLEEAVIFMDEKTQEGDIILLSPGCASLDMFKNYEERASIFVQAIHALK